MTAETSLDYGHPHRPAPLRLANRLPRLPGDGRLTTRGLIAAAERAERRRFTDRSFETGLRMLVDSIEAEAALNATGHAIVRQRLVTLLRTRLRVEAAEAKDPARFRRPLPRPIIICGLQRTGTTLLQRLLAGSGLRALQAYEALDPVPGPEAPKRRRARLASRALRYMAPDFFAVHPVEAEGVEEDVLLLDLQLHSTVPEATLRVPSYAAWVESQPATPAYAYAKKLLSGLGGGERWVLKTPHHLEFLEAANALFPDAVFVWTHRDPRVTVASFASMVAHGRGVFSDAVDPREIGRDWLRKIARMTDRGLRDRAVLGETRFIDVAYAELVADPMATALRVLQEAEAPAGEGARFGIAAALRANRPGRYGAHRYGLEPFGLSEAQVGDALGPYTGRFRPFL